MSLICPKCGSRNTRVFTAESLFRMTGSANFRQSTSGYVGIGVVITLLKELFNMLARFLGFLEQKEKNKAPVMICKKCGYWIRI